MTKEEAYRIFIDEIVGGDEKLKVVAEKNVMMPIAFNCAWAMASDNQLKIDTFKACEWWVDKLNSTEPVDFEKWVKEFRKAMKGE